MSQTYPLLPLRDIVVFPQMIVPLFVGRDKSVAALERAMEQDKEIFLVAQLDPARDDPDRDDLYDIGVVATVLQLLKLPDGTVRVLVEGGERARLNRLETNGDHVLAEVETIPARAVSGTDVNALMRSVVEQFENYAKLNKKLPAETAVQLAEIDDASKLADAVAANISVKVADKQSLLTEDDPVKRLEMVFGFMEGELGVLQVEKKIRGRVKRQMEKTQREYYLNEQLKAIQSELGNGDGDDGNGVNEFAEKIEKLKLSPEAKAKATADPHAGVGKAAPLGLALGAGGRPQFGHQVMHALRDPAACRIQLRLQCGIAAVPGRAVLTTPDPAVAKLRRLVEARSSAPIARARKSLAKGSARDERKATPRRRRRPS